ncbi:hypothetical protein JTB14_024494 [Gonioctena quinquepunctata]|nr:hypothetical protein JTB14_024494 [Gonioctena quinquepunctata]
MTPKVGTTLFHYVAAEEGRNPSRSIHHTPIPHVLIPDDGCCDDENRQAGKRGGNFILKDNRVSFEFSRIFGRACIWMSSETYVTDAVKIKIFG